MIVAEIGTVEQVKHASAMALGAALTCPHPGSAGIGLAHAMASWAAHHADALAAGRGPNWREEFFESMIAAAREFFEKAQEES